MTPQAQSAALAHGFTAWKQSARYGEEESAEVEYARTCTQTLYTRAADLRHCRPRPHHIKEGFAELFERVRGTHVCTPAHDV